MSAGTSLYNLILKEEKEEVLFNVQLIQSRVMNNWISVSIMNSWFPVFYNEKLLICVMACCSVRKS